MSTLSEGALEIAAGEASPVVLEPAAIESESLQMEPSSGLPTLQPSAIGSEQNPLPLPLPEQQTRRPSRLRKTMVALGSAISLLVSGISSPSTAKPETNAVVVDEAAAMRQESLSRRIERMTALDLNEIEQKTETIKKTLTPEQQALIEGFRISEDQKKFLGEMVEAMMEIGPYQTNRYVLLAQIWQEMGMVPDSPLEREHHNILGIIHYENKEFPNEATIESPTHEYVNGNRVPKTRVFVSFPSYAACIGRYLADEARLPHRQDVIPHYDRPEDSSEVAFQRMELFIYGLQHPESLAYATDPDYGKSLMFLIVKFIYPVMSLEPKPERPTLMGQTKAIGQEFDYPSDYEALQQLTRK